MNLYVVRHGQTDENVNGLINAWNDHDLNETGIKQAEDAKKEIGNLNLDIIICSPLKRTVETCKILNFNNNPVIYDERLIERNAGEMQFKPVTMLDINLWYDITKEVVYKDSEGMRSIIARIRDLISCVKSEYGDKNVLFVTHGDVARAIYAYLNNLTDLDKITEFYQQNCEIKHYEI